MDSMQSLMFRNGNEESEVQQVAAKLPRTRERMDDAVRTDFAQHAERVVVSVAQHAGLLEGEDEGDVVACGSHRLRRL